MVWSTPASNPATLGPLCCAGAILGGGKGAVQAVSAPVALAGVESSQRLRINQLLNTSGKMGRTAGACALLRRQFLCEPACGEAGGGCNFASPAALPTLLHASPFFICITCRACRLLQATRWACWACCLPPLRASPAT